MTTPRADHWTQLIETLRPLLERGLSSRRPRSPQTFDASAVFERIIAQLPTASQEKARLAIGDLPTRLNAMIQKPAGGTIQPAAPPSAVQRPIRPTTSPLGPAVVDALRKWQGR